MLLLDHRGSLPDAFYGSYRERMVRWDRSLIERWAFQLQLMAVALLGLAVLLPFVMLPAVIALAVTTLILGPRNVLSLARRPRDSHRTPEA